jgi:hypothetical protein
MKKLTHSIVPLALFAFVCIGAPQSANALSIDIFNVNTQSTQINNWISGIGGSASVVEDFESSTPGWYSELATAVGTFSSAGAKAGTGTTANKSETTFQIRDFDSNGRFNTTPNDGTNYLDSADITRITLDVKPNTFTNLFFYMTDPGDVGATTTTSSGLSSAFIPSGQTNGSGWFIGINSGNEYISQIVWDVSNTNDGIALDGFSAVAVPEPMTLFLLGSGLLGLGIYRRSRK